MKTKPIKLRQLTQSISLALIASTTAQSAEFIVTTTGDEGGGIANEVSAGVFEINTLRSAIELADNETAFPGADTVSFSPSLFNTGEAVINLNIIGDTFVFGGTSNSAFGINSEITVAGPTDATLTLTAGELRHFQVNDGGQLNISHVTLDDGFAPANSAGRGGAIYARRGSGLNVSHCTFTNNQAGSGGAVYIETNNEPNDPSSLIRHSRFYLNQATGGNSSNGTGGAVFKDGGVPLTISDSTFADNESLRGGGAVFNSGQLFIEASTLNNNTSGAEGGGIGGNNTGVLTLRNSTINNNKSNSYGGGIYIGTDPYEYGDISQIINSTITGNQSFFDSSPDDRSPAVLQNRLGGSEIYFDTSGGGIHARGYSDADNLLIHNSIIVGNTETLAVLADDVAAKLQSDSSHNFISVGESVFGTADGTNGNKIGTRDVPIDALLQPLADNGGFTLTQLPNPNSPVIDTGDTGLCEPIDQRGALRPADGDGDGSAVCDMGAVEVGAVIDLIFTDGFDG